MAAPQPSLTSIVKDWARAISRGCRCRCPKCGEGAMFRSPFKIHKRCPNCRTLFQPYEGDSLGVYAVCYSVSVVPAMLAFVLAFKYTQLGYMGLLGVFSVTTGVILFGFYRNMKGLWVALLYLMTGLKPGT